MSWKEHVPESLTAKLVVDDREIRQDTHKVDYVKGRVAFDLEWNSKDQTFDRDLFAFRTFFDYDKISVGILVTRSNQLDPWFASLGEGIRKKYGASTTHMGKLLPRLEAGRGGGCPILVFGMTTALLEE
ncbi:BglII/BstYI family type II restriction endonuclease [Desulfolutivibrio sulfoxidireducens]|uniref:BglII/BstYI family type II restriction endonuclease n=1 Tax=Desulfolutivibrio sulfoxidireducens TaxID=2773299 RepID=UPI00159E85EC|nr:BglII/BstYI family type II restriction endonuclease [Desulfolutivibrio sulfoxidireducens]QLA19019.1 restriction endonuclease [Desulfolutivibrio sulfoxidireducens]